MLSMTEQIIDISDGAIINKVTNLYYDEIVNKELKELNESISWIHFFDMKSRPMKT